MLVVLVVLVELVVNLVHISKYIPPKILDFFVFCYTLSFAYIYQNVIALAESSWDQQSIRECNYRLSRRRSLRLKRRFSAFFRALSSLSAERASCVNGTSRQPPQEIDQWLMLHHSGAARAATYQWQASHNSRSAWHGQWGNSSHGRGWNYSSSKWT